MTVVATNAPGVDFPAQEFTVSYAQMNYETASLIGSYNVSSITDSATGNFIVNFSNSLVSEYAAAGNSNSIAGAISRYVANLDRTGMGYGGPNSFGTSSRQGSDGTAYDSERAIWQVVGTPV